MAAALGLILCGPSQGATGPSAEPAKAAVISQAGNPRIFVDVVTLDSGRLVIRGSAANAGMLVRIQGTALQARANAQKAFGFNAPYRTADCRVTLQTNTGSLGLLIGNCGPGTVPRGPWSAGATYQPDDLVLLDGSTYRALRANRDKRPNAHAADWQVFAARGFAGPRGPRGIVGPEGAAGLAGPEGSRGPKGSQGDRGPPGATGARGAIGSQGDQGPPGVTPRGPWTASAQYAQHDLVFFDGSTFRALRANQGQQPDSNPDDWESGFASRGAPGDDGAAGPPGAAGQPGAPGQLGPPGDPGPRGPQGDIGARGQASTEPGPKGQRGPQGQPVGIFGNASQEPLVQICDEEEDLVPGAASEELYCVRECPPGQVGVFGKAQVYSRGYYEPDEIELYDEFFINPELNPRELSEPVNGEFPSGIIYVPEDYGYYNVEYYPVVLLLYCESRPEPPPHTDESAELSE